MGASMVFLKLLRVKQWIKNGFVLIPLVFSLQFMDFNSVKNAIIAFIAFCFASSFIYIINDIADRKADALHPKKKNRPIASGKISLPVAIIFSGLCIAIVVGLLLFMGGGRQVAICIGAYIILNLAYSKWLKHLPLVDAFCIAFGFVLRVYAGAYAIGVSVSSFLFMVALFLSLFLAFSKRRAELIKHGNSARKSLSGYSAQTLEKFQTLLAGAVIISYALYTLEIHTIDKFGNRLIYSIVFVIFGVFRYMEQSDKFADYEDPTENLYKDKMLIATCLTYTIYIILIATKVI